MDANDMLSSLLNDPQALQSALSMASSLLGGAAPPQMNDAPPPVSALPPAPEEAQAAASAIAYDPSSDLMRRALPVLGRIAQTGQSAVNPEKRDLLNAVKPFVGDNVAVQIDHGMKLVSLARMASAAMGQLGALSEEAHHV